MDAQERVDRFDFHDHQALDQDAETIARINCNGVILEGHGHLASHLKTSRQQFMHKTKLVGGLQKPRPERPMNLQARINDQARDILNPS